VHPSDFWGTRIILNPNLTEAGPPREVPRTWRERLFTLPWRPLVATKWITPQIPMQGGLQIGDKIMMHPQTYNKLKNIIR
jgi:hypothetical protein